MNTGRFNKAYLFYISFIAIPTVFCLFLSIYSYNSDQKTAIVDLAKKTFGTFKNPIFGSLPGLKKLLNGHNCQNDGPSFELLTALYLHGDNQNIIGLNLDIVVFDSEIGYLQDGSRVCLRSSEFDVITDKIVCECKSTQDPEIQKTKELAQFAKERSMLAWVTQVCEEIKTDKIDVSCRINRNGHFLLMLNGKCTGYKDVSLMSSWVDGVTEKECYAQWGRILHMLSNKSFMAVFKAPVRPDGLGQSLRDGGFKFIDRLRLSAIDSMTEKFVRGDIIDGDNLVLNNGLDVDSLGIKELTQVFECMTI
ncbi:MAG: hypothetical protein ABH827_03670 [bacterium]